MAFLVYNLSEKRIFEETFFKRLSFYRSCVKIWKGFQKNKKASFVELSCKRKSFTPDLTDQKKDKKQEVEETFLRRLSL